MCTILSFWTRCYILNIFTYILKLSATNKFYLHALSLACFVTPKWVSSAWIDRSKGPNICVGVTETSKRDGRRVTSCTRMHSERPTEGLDRETKPMRNGGTSASVDVRLRQGISNRKRFSRLTSSKRPLLMGPSHSRELEGAVSALTMTTP